MREAVIVSYGRTGIGRGLKGSLKDTRPDEFAAEIVREVLAKVPQLESEMIDDLMIGCAFPEAVQGLNIARTIGLRAGLSEKVSAQTINRFCASGLQAIATGSNSIIANQSDIVLAGGVESMSMVPMGGNVLSPNPYLLEHQPSAHITMGITAENVAEKYRISRVEQDEFAFNSHVKAAKAQKAGKFKEQIIPVNSLQFKGFQANQPKMTTELFATDESVRVGISAAALAKLRPVFKVGGTVTAGNSSPLNDGAAAVLLMEKSVAEEQGIKPLAKFLSYAVTGLDPAYMGLGPIKAIPKALAKAGIELEDVGLIELNEAFAAQAIACIKELNLNEEIINVNGGAIALGHPLGCTGAYLTAKLISEMQFRNEQYGIVSMCIGGGMGAAAVFELL